MVVVAAVSTGPLAHSAQERSSSPGRGFRGWNWGGPFSIAFSRCCLEMVTSERPGPLDGCMLFLKSSTNSGAFGFFGFFLVKKNL